MRMFRTFFAPPGIWFTCPLTVTHPSSNHLTAFGMDEKHTTSRSYVQHFTVALRESVSE